MNDYYFLLLQTDLKGPELSLVNVYVIRQLNVLSAASFHLVLGPIPVLLVHCSCDLFFVLIQHRLQRDEIDPQLSERVRSLSAVGFPHDRFEFSFFRRS